jgi:hypothetical protein
VVVILSEERGDETKDPYSSATVWREKGQEFAIGVLPFSMTVITLKLETHVFYQHSAAAGGL